MDLRKLKSLIDLVSESEIAELEISEGEDRVKIVKEVKKTQGSKKFKKSNSVDFSEQFVSQEDIQTSENISEAEHVIITSPMVGTFYVAPSPNSDPFVKVGENIKKDQTLCVIEAMKLMNEIPSVAAGTLSEVLVENGQPVEFGQPLFKLINN
ncbi:MAG: acetyl-CoA carboxylase, biotin carboxyl carrier protein [Betaproteobacteria bacterium TMED82]|nr:MAG: acetyl-CoA carboxylase, biotin carboxyl carrier protein [Betaproteobacteria bacterium TMED82]|tara:strand:+ start:74235 stop:74693 length:459 start_codon:yes stop_codon:yes gene_type:complete